MNRRMSHAVAVRFTLTRFLVTQTAIAIRRELFDPRGRELVEGRDRVGLGPKPDLPGVREGRVARVDDLLAVPVNDEMITPRLCPQLAPLVCGHLPAPARDLLTLSIPDVVQPDVVLQRVRACHVVVVLVAVPEDEAARLVNLACHGLAPDRDAEVPKRRLVDNSEGVSVASRVVVDLHEHVVAARSE